MSPFHVASFYEFARWSEPFAVEASDFLTAQARELSIVGLCVTGVEGVNCTCAGAREDVERFIDSIRARLGLELASVKWSVSESAPFAKFRAPLRPEIVTLGDSTLLPSAPEHGFKARRASPAEFRAALSDPRAVFVDTRNWYESRIGKFPGAIEPRIDEFHEFGDWLKNANLKRDQPTFIYCTGGIRCEKAVLEMERQGFEDVRQLDGGILKYVEEYPNDGFEGECFVFDRRVALDQSLRPSKRFTQCPHCGQPAAAEDSIDCIRCGDPARVCEACRAQENLRTCSRNCAHHWKLAPGKLGRSQRQAARRALSGANVASVPNALNARSSKKV